MELSDYDILGITPDSTFRLVKNTYYELSKIYHPDSSQIIIGMSKEDRIISFQRIQKAYENIKEKLNIVEIDMPKEEIEYTDSSFDKPNVIIDENLSEFIICENEKSKDIEDTKDIQKPELEEKTNETKEFHKKFNKQFNSIFDRQILQDNIDNPFSIYYEEPEESKRNIQDSKLALLDLPKNNKYYEFGINYVEDHSCELYADIRQLKIKKENTEDTKKNKFTIKSIKDETISNKEFDSKLEEMIKKREELQELLSDKKEEDKEFLEQQKQIKERIQMSKNKIEKERNKRYLL